MERLHKFMAHCGIASRRQAEDYIRQKRVTVNGEIITELGVKIDPEKDVITVDGQTLKPEKKVCYLLHKPRGYATTVEDDLGRRTVLDLLPDVKERIYPAGRLDLDSEGLIVLTNDGDAAYYLTHPSCGVRKVYEALVEGNVENETIEILLEKGVYLGTMHIKPIMAKIVKRQTNATVVRIIVAEGVNREVRRLFAVLGHEVKRLVRLEVGPFKIDGITRGKYRLATPQEMAALRASMMNAPEKSSVPSRPRKKKYGPPLPRPGKPDPALYGKGDKPKRAPIILKKKVPDEYSATFAEEAEDASYFDAESAPISNFRRPPHRGVRDEEQYYNNGRSDSRPSVRNKSNGQRKNDRGRDAYRGARNNDAFRYDRRNNSYDDDSAGREFHRSRSEFKGGRGGRTAKRDDFAGQREMGGRYSGRGSRQFSEQGERHERRGGRAENREFHSDFRRPLSSISHREEGDNASRRNFREHSDGVRSNIRSGRNSANNRTSQTHRNERTPGRNNGRSGFNKDRVPARPQREHPAGAGKSFGGKKSPKAKHQSIRHPMSK